MAEQTGWGALLRVVDTILPGAAGALVSLRFIPGTPVQRVASLLLGIACAHYLGNGVIGLWHVPAGLESDAIKFIAGVFGLTIVGYAYGELPALRRLVHDWLQQAAQRWMGGRKE
ncbi:hypothetical protein [Ralstonia pickettii]|uniref:hypothetical protein n=1 Tax=Ralstonia pickettii TaxID=329 RepID=UPI0004685CBC|nr:hypothetical protein [Ralstonia pickettii]